MGKAAKLVALAALTLGLAAAIAACGGGTDSSESTGGGSEKLSGTVEIWDTEYELYPGYTKTVDRLDAEFEKLHPEVTVKRVAQPGEGYEALVRAAFVSGDVPDLLLAQAGAPGVVSFADGLENLDDWISPEMDEQLGLWETVTTDFTADGERYGVPAGLTGFAFYFNKKMFKEAGLPTDFQPQTWAEVREAGEKLKAAGIQPFIGGNKEGYESQFWFSIGFGSENSPEATSELGTGALPYTSEEVTKAWGPMIEIEEAGLYPADRNSTELFEGFSSFSKEKAAIVLGLWTTVGYWGEFNPELGEENVGLFFPPGAIQTTGSVGITMPKDAKNKDAAWALIEFETSKKSWEALYEDGGLLPNRKDVSLPADAPVQAKEIVEASRGETVLAPISVVPSAVTFGPMSTEMQQVLAGRTSLEDAQKAMQEVAEKSQ